MADMNDQIREALSLLDHREDAHWTTAGKPSCALVSELVQSKVTRAQIEAVAPELEREAAEPEPEADAAKIDAAKIDAAMSAEPGARTVARLASEAPVDPTPKPEPVEGSRFEKWDRLRVENAAAREKLDGVKTQIHARSVAIATLRDEIAALESSKAEIEQRIGATREPQAIARQRMHATTNADAKELHERQQRLARAQKDIGRTTEPIDQYYKTKGRRPGPTPRYPTKG